ncbi:MAG TPA: ROK family protein [Acidimicrobiales bacterium]|nr:ROK family protein [Acidimicrobiales bacterium]
MDIGGTKMAAGVVTRQGTLVGARQVATPVTDDAEELFAVLVAEVGLVLAEGRRADAGPLAACGVGCGGPMSSGGETVSPLNIPAWRDFPLRARLEALTGLPTGVENDAKALALGEGWRGAARARRDFLAMVVSTGVGGGIVLDGRLLHGAAGNAGHIGHVIVEPDGRRCACGGQGCLEAEASGTAIAAATGRPPAEAGEDVVERSGRLVGRAVASVVALLDLELAVISGGVALGFGSPFFSAATRELRDRAGLSYTRMANIVPGELGAAGPLVGAGAVGWRTVGRPVDEIAL